ncbi:MAG: hypothetical protein HFF09_00675 [Oscillospiraceae bacterium]|nr:hypothetical protein [Oscillospiraceae bacterium]
MKTPKAVVIILCAILATNIAGVTLHTVEMRKQTKIQFCTAQITEKQAELITLSLRNPTDLGGENNYKSDALRIGHEAFTLLWELDEEIN